MTNDCWDDVYGPYRLYDPFDEEYVILPSMEDVYDRIKSHGRTNIVAYTLDSYNCRHLFSSDVTEKQVEAQREKEQQNGK